MFASLLAHNRGFTPANIQAAAPAEAIAVQRETATWATADKTFTITAVDTANAIARWAAAHWSPTNLDGDDGGGENTSGLSFPTTSSVLADGAIAGVTTGRKGSLEVWELPSGPNFGIALRYFDDVSFTSGEFTKDIDLSSAGISAIGDCAAILCSIRQADVDNTPFLDCAFVTCEVLDDSGNKLRVTRGDDVYDSTARIAVLEFTGSNWSVQKVKHTIAAAGTEETETISAVDWDHAFVFGSSEDIEQDIGNICCSIYPGATSTTVAFQNGGGNAAYTGTDIVAYVVEDTSGTVVCEHKSFTIGGSDEAIAWTNTFPSARSIFFLSADFASTGSANARQFVNYDHTGDQAGNAYRESGANDPDTRLTAVKFPATGS